MNELYVSKFGGTSVRDHAAMLRSAKLVVGDPRVRVIVVSACSDMTDRSVALAAGGLSEGQRSLVVEAIIKHHNQILAQIEQIQAVEPSVKQRLADYYADFDQITQVAQTNLSIEQRQLHTDALLAYGEIFSSCLFTEVLKQLDANSVWFDVRSIMRTDSSYQNAQPQISELARQTQSLLLPKLSDNRIVTQGFIGSDGEGVTTTLG